MAGIDKIYATFDELVEFRRWAKKHARFLLGGIIPVDEYLHYWGRATEQMPICNFGCFEDWFLYHNCPVPFVHARLREQHPSSAPRFRMSKRRSRKQYDYNSWWFQHNYIRPMILRKRREILHERQGPLC